MKNAEQQYTGLEIAIVGMAGRFPKSENWREYWENLTDGNECITFYTDDELLERGVDTFKIGDPDYVKAGGIIKGKKYFDSSFFEYRPDEAKLLNPLHRIFHECLWEALEDGGIDPEKAKGLIGLYAGAGNDIAWKVYSTIMNIDQITGSFLLNFINNKDYMASLLAYKLNLKGSAYTMDTACSTSLAAVHQACRSLLLGEVRTALAGAVSLKTRKVSGFYPVKGGINSHDGHCRAFDKDADGTVESEGAGVVVLKRLKDAITDKDYIYAVIKGSATNNDGIRKVGYTAPSVDGQAECIKMAYGFSRVDPASVSYVETHGTGTRLGDPIEIEALNRAFGKKEGHRVAIGSVKTNIGHTDTAAGIAGLIKTALSLKYKKIPASLHFNEANPDINFAEGPFYVNTKLSNWEQIDAGPLRAGVSSFGIGGTNVHVVMEEAPQDLESDGGNNYKLLTISAKKENSVLQYMKNLGVFVAKDADVNLSDLAYSLQTGRKQFQFCKSLVYSSAADLIAGLKEAAETEVLKRKDHIDTLVLLFPDDQLLYPGIGKNLYLNELVFKQEMDKGFSLLQTLTGIDYKAILYSPTISDNRINESEYKTPLAFIYQYALAKLVMAKGITPSCVVGYQVGEFVAVCITGIMKFDDVLELVILRSRLSNDAKDHGVDKSEYTARFKRTEKSTSQIEFIAGTTGLKINEEETAFDGSWVQDLKKSDELNTAAIKTIMGQGRNVVFVDMGDGECWGPVLAGYKFKEPPVNVCLSITKDNEANDAKYFLEQVGILWCNSVQILWDTFYQNEKRKKIPLPTYAFEKIEYPVEFNLTDIFKDKGGLLVGKMESISDWFYRPQWKQSNWLKKDKLLVDDGGSTIIFSSSNLISQRVYDRFAVMNNNVIVVEIGANFKKINSKHYQVNPILKAHYQSLFTDIKTTQSKISRIIHLWNFDKPDQADGEISNNLNLYLSIGYDSVLEIVKNYSVNYNVQPVKIDMISNGLFNVLGNEELKPIKATSLGALKVIPLEFHNITTRSIDLFDESDDAARALLKELNYAAEETEVAIRGRSRYVKYFENIKAKPPQANTTFKQNGTYVITGANGGMGKLFSNFLATNYNANLILVGRAKEPGTYISELQEKGAKVLYLQADVADAANLIEKLEETEKVFQTINGVIHTAGTADYGGVILRRSSQDDNKVFSAKITGTEVLFSVFAKKRLDFFINCSSISASLPTFGQVAYVGANAYLDAFAELKGQSYPVISIAWCALNEIGMAAKSANIMNVQETEFSIKPLEAVELLQRCIHLEVSSPLISKVDFNYFLKHYLSQFSINNKIGEASHEGVYQERPVLAVAFEEPVTKVEKQLAELWKTFFGINKVGVSDDFFALGGDSLSALLICKRIHEASNVEVSLGDFFQDPTIKGIAGKIAEQQILEGMNVKSIII